ARAKELLSLRRGYTEAEAHRYLQKTSMDSGTNLVEAAYMVIDMFAPK
ncbi:MAG: ANTAR domain-containing protein, partial [Lachnospiraceae bacterium]|nr:ANTAR domain-containing protein [Lachnospiraceae bacterium]